MQVIGIRTTVTKQLYDSMAATVQARSCMFLVCCGGWHLLCNFTARGAAAGLHPRRSGPAHASHLPVLPSVCPHALETPQLALNSYVAAAHSCVATCVQGPFPSMQHRPCSSMCSVCLGRRRSVVACGCTGVAMTHRPLEYCTSGTCMNFAFSQTCTASSCRNQRVN